MSSALALPLTLTLPRAAACGAAALACEAAAFVFAGGLGAFWALHCAASALAATALRGALPESLVSRPRAAWIYLFALPCFLPGLGLAVALGLVVTTRRMAHQRARRRFGLHPGPSYEAGGDEPAQPATGRLRLQLANTAGAAESRLRALLAVRAMPARMANPLIREMLTDPSEDLRLIAYGILDAREKTLNARIHAATRKLAAAPSRRSAVLHKQLAELYGELVYQGLVQGDLREHAAARARSHVEAALSLDPQAPALHALHGRIALGAGDYAAANAALERALELGVPASRVLPYLAESAFRMRRFDEVRAIARRLAALPNTPRVEALIEYWRLA